MDTLISIHLSIIPYYARFGYIKTKKVLGFTPKKRLPCIAGRALYQSGYFYCPVGRGDPTPPCSLPVRSICRDGCNGRSMTAPTAQQKPSPLGGRWRGTRRMRGKCPAVAPSSVTFGDSFPQRGKPFGRFARNVVITVKLRAGHTPPLPRGVFLLSRRAG